MDRAEDYASFDVDLMFRLKCIYLQINMPKAYLPAGYNIVNMALKRSP